MIVKLLTEHHLEFLSLKGGYRGSFETTLVKLFEVSCRGSYSVTVKTLANRLIRAFTVHI